MGKNSNAGFITHCNPIRLRVTGEGDLKTALFDLGTTNFEYLTDYAMTDITGRFATILSNFESEKIQFEFRTTEIDERFRISSIVPFVKPTATSYPQ